MSFYQDFIHKLDKTVNPAGVEASMRLVYPVLSDLDKQTFLSEIQMAKECEVLESGFLLSTAETFGLKADYEKWEKIIHVSRA